MSIEIGIGLFLWARRNWGYAAYHATSFEEEGPHAMKVQMIAISADGSDTGSSILFRIDTNLLEEMLAYQGEGMFYGN